MYHKKKNTSFSGIKNTGRQRPIDRDPECVWDLRAWEEESVWEIVRRTASMTRRGRKSACPASGGSRAKVRITRTGPYFPGAAAAPAAKQKRRVSVVALGKKPRSVNYFGPITAHNKGPGESRNTSSCYGISPSLVQPDGAARDEKARAGSEEGRRFCFYLICPERERERGAMGDELSPRPPFLGALQDTPRPYPRKVVQSSTLDRADADTRPLLSPPSRSSLLHPFHCPLPLLRALLAALFLQRLFTAGVIFLEQQSSSIYTSQYCPLDIPICDWS